MLKKRKNPIQAHMWVSLRSWIEVDEKKKKNKRFTSSRDETKTTYHLTSWERFFNSIKTTAATAFFGMMSERYFQVFSTLDCFSSLATSFQNYYLYFKLVSIRRNRNIINRPRADVEAKKARIRLHHFWSWCTHFVSIDSLRLPGSSVERENSSNNTPTEPVNFLSLPYSNLITFNNRIFSHVLTTSLCCRIFFLLHVAPFHFESNLSVAVFQ